MLLFKCFVWYVTHGFKISPRKFETFLDYWTTFQSTNLECIPWWKWSPPRLSDNTHWFSYNLFYLFLVPSQYTKNKSSWVYLTWPYCKIHKLIVQIMKTIMLCKVPGISHCVHFVTLLENLTHTLGTMTYTHILCLTLIMDLFCRNIG